GVRGGGRRSSARVALATLKQLLLAASLAFVAHRALAPMSETDLFFHLKIGDIIREQHAIPFRNLFSFTYPDHPDPDLSWGFQVVVSVLHQLGGFPAIVLFKTLLIVAAAAPVVARTRPPRPPP